jgi:hypothetical protein
MSRSPDVDHALPSPPEAIAAWLGAYRALRSDNPSAVSRRAYWRRDYFFARQTVIAVLMQQPKRTAVVGHDTWTARYDLEVDAWMISWAPAGHRNGRAS